MGTAIRLTGLAALSFAIGLLVSSRLSTAVVDIGLLIALGVFVGCLHLRWLTYLYQQLLAGALFCAGVVIGSGKFVELSPLIISGRYWAVLMELPELIFQAFMPAMLGVLLVYLIAQVVAD